MMFGGAESLFRLRTSSEYRTLEEREEIKTSFSDKVAAILAREGISAPPIQFDVALIAHSTAKDAVELRKNLDESDIFIPEMSGATEEHINILNRLSRGEITPRQAYRLELIMLAGSTILGTLLSLKKVPTSNFHEFNTRLNRLIYKSNKKISHIDLKREDPLLGKMRRSYLRIIQASIGLFVDKNQTFEDARQKLVDAHTTNDELQKEREEHMLEQLPHAIANAIKNDPELQSSSRKKPIKVFLFLGAAHDNIPKTIEKSGDEIHYKKSKKGEILTSSPSYKDIHAEAPESYGDFLVLQTIFSMLYIHTPKKIKQKYRKFVKKYGEGVLLGVLSQVYLDKTEEIFYAVQKNTPKSPDDFKYSRFVIEYFITLLNEREEEINIALKQVK